MAVFDDWEAAMKRRDFLLSLIASRPVYHEMITFPDGKTILTGPGLPVGGIVGTINLDTEKMAEIVMKQILEMAACDREHGHKFSGV